MTTVDVLNDFDWANATNPDDSFETSMEALLSSSSWQMKPHRMGPNEHIVYSFWDDNKICIYVGITNNPWARMGHHIKMSEFAWEIFEWRVEAVNLDRTTALQLETILISRWNPRCNDRKSIYGVIEHSIISSVDADEVYFQRSCRGTALSDAVIGESSWTDYGYESFPKIVQDHEIRFQKWLQDYPEVDIRQWAGATGINWSSLLSLKRSCFLQDAKGRAQ